jgi:UPF0176 protein
LQALCDTHGIKGILLLAPEGINGTLAGPADELAIVTAEIRRILGRDDIDEKISRAESLPFLRMKVRLKTEIVTIGDTSVDPLEQTGIEVEPEDWNALVVDPDVVVIDVRNDFECAVGSFAGAIDPDTASFGEFPAFVRETLDPRRHKKVAMFCTGGIRCEKASSFMLREGFEQVYQLKGGILAYLDRISVEESLWRGACFVFDQRVALGHGLEIADLSTCFGCRHPLSVDDRTSSEYEEGVSCPHCKDRLTPEQKASARERHRQVKLAEKQGIRHLGTATQQA